MNAMLCYFESPEVLIYEIDLLFFRKTL